jgi:urease accessory protein
MAARRKNGMTDRFCRSATARTGLLLFLSVLLAASPGTAFAHAPGEIGGGFTSGFLHPLLGWDHVAAMVAVGVLGTFLGSPAIWLLPIVFPLVMALGGALGIAGVPIPWVEPGIALSAVVLGVLIAAMMPLPVWVAAVVVGVFAVFHGHAHGTELPHAMDALTYSVGFVIATGLLHLVGIGFGLLVRWPAGLLAVRGAGVVIALAGVAFLVGLD